LFEFESSGEISEIQPADSTAAAGEFSEATVEIGYEDDDEDDYYYLSDPYDAFPEKNTDIPPATIEDERADYESPLLTPVELDALAIGMTDDSTADSEQTPPSDAPVAKAVKADPGQERDTTETKEPSALSADLQTDPENRISTPESTAAITPEAQDNVSNTDGEIEKRELTDTDKQGYQIRINESGMPHEITAPMARREQLSEQIDRAYWHIIQNPQEDSSLDLDATELSDKPDDTPITLGFDTEGLPPTMIIARSLDELGDIMEVAIRKLTPDYERYKDTVANALVHEESHIAGYIAIGGEETILPGLCISSIPGEQPTHFGRGLLDYSHTFSLTPFVTVTHLETTKLGLAVVTVAPLSREFSRPDLGRPHLTPGDISKIVGMGYTDLNDLSQRIAAYNESHPDRPLPRLTFPDGASLY
jgi:hypothetical protein